MKIQIISDIHLEFNPKFYPQKAADNIALLGDIGYPHTKVYQEFINKLSNDFDNVFVIPGNHEYYGSTYDNVNEFLTNLCSSFTNVHFLNNKVFVHNNIRIIGTTLWSNITNGFVVMTRINDYRYIKNKNGNSISFHDVNKWHENAVEFIQQQIKEATDLKQKLVVFSHHAPTYQENERPVNKITCAFRTDLDYLIKYPIVYWCYGHTHHSTKFKINDVDIISNQVGYIREHTKYNPRLFIEVE